MSQFRTHPDGRVIAHRWKRNGDHPLDGPARSDPRGAEGEFVRYWRRPGVPGETPCPKCAKPMHDHGWVEGRENVVIDDMTICPDSWIVRWPDATYTNLSRAVMTLLFAPEP